MQEVKRKRRRWKSEFEYEPHELWLQDGGMEGCADEYWRQAREMVEQELREEQAGSPPTSWGQA